MGTTFHTNDVFIVSGSHIAADHNVWALVSDISE